MPAELVQYHPRDDGAIDLLVVCEGRRVVAKLRPTKDQNNRISGYMVWIRPLPHGLATPEEAVAAALEYVERMVVGAREAGPCRPR